MFSSGFLAADDGGDQQNDGAERHREGHNVGDHRATAALWPGRISFGCMACHCCGEPPWAMNERHTRSSASASTNKPKEPVNAHDSSLTA